MDENRTQSGTLNELFGEFYHHHHLYYVMRRDRETLKISWNSPQFRGSDERK